MTFVDMLIERFGLDTDQSRCTAIWADSLKQWIENQADVTEQIERVFGETKTCPNCGRLVGTPYCPICGTKIEWEVEQ